ncbi:MULTISPECIES: PIG-L family deacetylase [unclassified Arthrobacter]|uniref:PIG-L family deacetylase n=1 Tax=unclassified Arthrobacter TaxID=235627 RepID=UPI00159D3D53|nr:MULTISPECIES: PIG-L family deacetylase [unclassified Arthrobacter]MCQ9165947.1 PIG-L family deacetylase [Arthrobacter sp. STN4]NVM99695.1 1D-myo-inositol 2-acetamido-2-deoxy-alpha-D-glucopyranoside deacetylase [Arthrobacter sp. SDTb3-6]
MEIPTLLPGVGPDATLLFIHAHPDDETLATGSTIAAYAAAGARVALLTCTRGELGEVIPAELGHLEVGRALRLPAAHDAGTGPGAPPADGTGLARVRERELAAALEALGVREHLWLGQGATAPAAGPVVFRDSGMQWGPDGRAMAASTVLEGSLSRGSLEGEAALAAAAIRALRPDAVVTYAADGGYGHPDHVRTHELVLAALGLAAGAENGTPGWTVPHVFAIVSDRPERPLEPGTARIAVAGNKAAKAAAMRAHRTQITVDGDRYALSDGEWRDICGVEEFVELMPAPSSGAG